MFNSYEFDKFHAIQTDEITFIALLVIHGIYGNGEERKKNLSSIGVDYKKVQACVNDLLPVYNKHH